MILGAAEEARSAVESGGVGVRLDDLSSGRQMSFVPRRLVISGLTSRFRDENQRHVDEMSANGIEISSPKPIFFELSPALVCQSDVLPVSSHASSGEVEPVLFCTAGGWYIGVGSDHTARDVAQRSVADGKSTCGKPVAREVIAADQVEAHWDEFELRSHVDGKLYQRAPLSNMMPVSEIVSAYQKDAGRSLEGLVMFLGTVPLVDGRFVYGHEFNAELVGRGISIICSYDVVTSSR